LMKLSAGAEANVKQWADLPPLNDFNKTLDAKVGGIVLARGKLRPEAQRSHFPRISATAGAAPWRLPAAAPGAADGNGS
jgi:hypothetical protein